jgi:hypothetical protein
MFRDKEAFNAPAPCAASPIEDEDARERRSLERARRAVMAPILERALKDEALSGEDA